MNALWIIGVSFLGYLVAYYTYGRFLARRIFKLDDSNVVPSQQFNDGHDYVPTEKEVIFGHHFTSIAGTGPIVGPAIGVIWGWIPALIWIFLGSILMGAVHDFGTLVVSMRNEGKSIASIAEIYVNKRVKLLFFLIVLLSLLIVIAIFGLVISLIFSKFPESVFSVWAQIPIAVMMGYFVNKKGGSLVRFTSLSVILMYITMVIGRFVPIELTAMAGIPVTGLWTILLLTYAFFASGLSVTTLLQPRDYINAWQLYIAMGVILVGAVVSGVKGDLVVTAPGVFFHPPGAPSWWPFLFITIACGAVSGFHSLVSSGTSSKQVKRESDALFVGYGSMLVEAALATLVVVAVIAGLSLDSPSAFHAAYSSWEASSGLSAKLSAVVSGTANMMEYAGVPFVFGMTLMGVFIASFAGTTLDTSTRLQRYIISELFGLSKWKATGLAVVSAGVLAFSSGMDGKGALALWPLFGAVNQLLAALALMIVTVYLRKQGGAKFLITGIPCLFMLVMTVWSCVENQMSFYVSGNWVLFAINLAILSLSGVMVLESFLTFIRSK